MPSTFNSHTLRYLATQPHSLRTLEQGKARFICLSTSVLECPLSRCEPLPTHNYYYIIIYLDGFVPLSPTLSVGGNDFVH